MTAPSEPSLIPCAAHPATETRLRCTECDAGICPRCMVPYEAGFKCPACARRRTSHVHRMAGGQWLLTAGLAVLAGYLYGYLHPWLLSVRYWVILGIPILSLVLGYYAGWGAGALIHRAIRYKLNPALLKVITGGAALGLLLGPFRGVLGEAWMVLRHAGAWADPGSLWAIVLLFVRLLVAVLFIKGLRRPFGG